MSRVIEMLGLPGSGKTTIARLVATSLNLRLALENVADNKFLVPSSIARKPPSLENSLFFLMDFAGLFASNDCQSTFYDSGLFLDLAYARATLPPDEAKLFEAVAWKFLAVGYKPAAVIRMMQAPADCFRRLKERDGRTWLTESDMERLGEQITRIADEAGRTTPVIEVDSSKSPEETAKEISKKLTALYPDLESISEGRR